jgi:uncharacterized protein involved in type VI secretion and phage assembly
MSTIISTIQQIVRQELRAVRTSQLGLVDAVYPHGSGSDNGNYACDVRLKNSSLLLKQVPLTTDRIGTAAIPNKGDLVLVTFENGDVNQPIVIGRLYNEADRPPLNNSNEVIFRLPLAQPDDKTVKGAIRNLQANSPPREIIIQMMPKVTLRINDGMVQATAGNCEMKLDQTNETGGTVTIFAGSSKITINQDGDVNVEAAGDLTLKATGDVSIEGQNISLNAQEEIHIQAQMDATITASTGATIDGGVSATLQGASVSVNGIASFAP